MKTFLKLTGAFMLAVCIGAALGAGVNGVFTTVNAISGYKLNGAAGSSGQALCSDGTLFDTPCNVAPAFTGTSGYQKLPSGLILEWGVVPDTAFSLSQATATFPLAFPTACLFAQAGQYQPSATESQEVLVYGSPICTTSTVTLRENGDTDVTYFAIGY